MSAIPRSWIPHRQVRIRHLHAPPRHHRLPQTVRDLFYPLSASLTPSFHSVEMVMAKRYAPYTEKNKNFLVGKSMPKLAPRDGSDGWDKWFIVALVIAFGSAIVQWRTAVGKEIAA